MQNALKRAKFNDLYEPLAKLMRNAKLIAPSKEQIDSGECCVFTIIGVCVKPVIKLDMKKYLRSEDTAFICLPFKDSEGNESFKILIKSPTTGSLFFEMRDCKLLDEESNDEQDKKYIEIFIKAVNFIHARLNLSEKASEEINLSVEEALSEFAKLAQVEDKSEELLKRFLLAKNEPKKCAKILKEKEILWQGYEKHAPSWEFLVYNFILKDMLQSFESHWEIDVFGLKKYIKQATNTEFRITKNQILEPYKIASKLEEISDYTLLNVCPDENSIEGYCFFACAKERKDRILKLAEFLNLNIYEF